MADLEHWISLTEVDSGDGAPPNTGSSFKLLQRKEKMDNNRKVSKKCLVSRGIKFHSSHDKEPLQTHSNSSFDDVDNEIVGRSVIFHL